ncbi:hypothetical protein EMA8858_02479 [Emticicia aquatica]|jgi:hypothetical protein|uniref:NodB homology domain-containing protein n=1 Tax=Emticicia aquatica TaxID=1681835 RepID=A0ABN8ETK2_9BACT|nr:hypothetical protein EMA8858_02479 [Emticicia aquatica]
MVVNVGHFTIKKGLQIHENPFLNDKLISPKLSDRNPSLLTVTFDDSFTN